MAHTQAATGLTAANFVEVGDNVSEMLDTSGDLSTRDRFKLNFGACAIAGNVVSGHSEFVVASHRFEGTNEITELDFRFNALGSAAMRWSGTAHALLRSDLQRGAEYAGEAPDSASQSRP